MKLLSIQYDISIPNIYHKCKSRNNYYYYYFLEGKTGDMLRKIRNLKCLSRKGGALSSQT